MQTSPPIHPHYCTVSHMSPLLFVVLYHWSTATAFNERPFSLLSSLDWEWQWVTPPIALVNLRKGL